MMDHGTSGHGVRAKETALTQAPHRTALYTSRLLYIFFALVAVSWIHRLLALRVYAQDVVTPAYNPSGPLETMELIWMAQGDSLLSGAASDVLFAALFAAILAFSVIPAPLRILAIAVLVIFHAADYEHIKYNFSHINLAAIGLALSPTFIAAQSTPGLMKVLAVYGVTAVIMVVAGAWLLRASRQSRLFRSIRMGASGLAIGLCAVAFVIPKDIDFLEPEWMQTHPLLPRFNFDAEGIDTRPFTDLQPPKSPVALADTAKHNVLVVYLESLSTKSIESGNMETLARLERENISFRRYFGNQLVTANGLYSTLTGERPNFLSKSLRWTRVAADSDIARNALPARLRDAGYDTSFLQSAELAYMKKDSVLPLLGFETLKGAESWSGAYSMSGWGVDDRTLFENTLAHIDTLDGDTPWFVSVLTAGTHAPYNVPTEITNGRLPTRADALAYLDSAVKVLVDGLEQRGLLKNTVVILTSDESRERSLENPILDELYLYWLPLIVLHPDRIDTDIDSFLATTDFPEIVSALAGDADVDTLRDRPAQDTPLVFGNLHTKRLFYFSPQKDELFLCKLPSFECGLYKNVQDPLDMQMVDPATVAVFPELAQIIERHDAGQ